MRSLGSAEELERRRLLAVRRVDEGNSAAAVSKFLGVNERTVRGWYNRYLQGGEAALAPKPRPQNVSRLTPEQESAVLGWLDRNPTDPALGFPVELWTANRVANLVRRHFGVRYHPGHLSRWLRIRGVTPQKVRCRPRGHDAGEMKRWAREEWPRIKKKAAGSALSPRIFHSFPSNGMNSPGAVGAGSKQNRFCFPFIHRAF